MRAEFSKDENGTIWFVYASRINARRVEDLDLKEER